MKKILVSSLVTNAFLLVFSLGTSSAALISSFTHYFEFGGDPSAVRIDVNVYDDYFGDTSKYFWEYVVSNYSYDPDPGISNGFSGFELALPVAVPDIGDIQSPSGPWEVDAYSGMPVEWDIKNSLGIGIMPGDSGVFGFTTLPRIITTSSGWFHTWEGDVQTYIIYHGLEAPDVRTPSVPEPGTLLLLGSGLAGIGFYRRRIKKARAA